MPLIQWIMQNLSKKYIIQGSGGVIIYGDSIESFTEYKFNKLVKFNIGSTGYDLNGYPWTITGVHISSNEEITYFAKTGKINSSFKNSKIFVNRKEIKNDCADCLCSLQKCLDRPIENLPTYQGKKIIKA